jgi:hypothetical protein
LFSIKFSTPLKIKTYKRPGVTDAAEKEQKYLHGKHRVTGSKVKHCSI